MFAYAIKQFTLIPDVCTLFSQNMMRKCNSLKMQHVLESTIFYKIFERQGHLNMRAHKTRIICSAVLIH